MRRPHAAAIAKVQYNGFRFSNMDTKQIIRIALIVLIIGVLIGGGIFLFAVKRSADSESASPTPTPTETVEEPTPTDDAIPTTNLTPTKSVTATPTRRPTATPTRAPATTPSSTPTPAPTATTGVVNIENSVSPTTSAACTQNFVFSAKIYTNGAATVKYKWLRSDGATAPEQTITFTDAGMQTVTTTWSRGPIAAGETATGWERIEILSPGSGLSNQAEYTLTCTSPTPTPTP